MCLPGADLILRVDGVKQLDRAIVSLKAAHHSFNSRPGGRGSYLDVGISVSVGVCVFLCVRAGA